MSTENENPFLNGIHVPVYYTKVKGKIMIDEDSINNEFSQLLTQALIKADSLNKK